MAGTRGVGKTTFAENIALACVEHRGPVLFLSLLEKRAAVEQRCLTARAMLRHQEEEHGSKALVVPQPWPLYVAAAPTPFISASKVAELAADLPDIHLVIVDSLRFVSPFTDRPGDEIHIEAAVAALKHMAMKQRCHILVVANVPTTKDIDDIDGIRLNSRIVDIADIVLTMDIDAADRDKDVSKTVIALVRNRYGTTGRLNMLFYKQEGVFAEYSLVSPEDLLRRRNNGYLSSPRIHSAEEICTAMGRRLAAKFRAKADTTTDACERELYLFGAALLQGSTR